MLYYLHWLFPLLKHQTFRGISAVLTAFLLSFIISPFFIEKVKKYQQPIRTDGPQRHLEEKVGTPTMGGLIIVVSVTISSLLWGNLKIPHLWVILTSMWGFAGIGFFDDIKKILRRKGISAKQKFLLQIIFSMCLSFLIYMLVGGALYIPFKKQALLELPVAAYMIWGSAVLIGSSNAVNLTDGLDGLAIFPVMISSFSLAIIAYAVGHLFFAMYLHIPHVSNVGELIVFLGSWMGASLGFLWYNAPPAKIFMGDTGSLAAGASLGATALLVKHEITWAVIGGLFVVEALSVIIQVFSYKWRRKRVFLMAPIHHHYEQKGLKEPTIVIRFWIVSVILSLIGLATLKIR